MKKFECFSNLKLTDKKSTSFHCGKSTGLNSNKLSDSHIQMLLRTLVVKIINNLSQKSVKFYFCFRCKQFGEFGKVDAE